MSAFGWVNYPHQNYYQTSSTYHAYPLIHLKEKRVKIVREKKAHRKNKSFEKKKKKRFTKTHELNQRKMEVMS